MKECVAFFPLAIAIGFASRMSAEKPFDFAVTPRKLPKQVVPTEYSVRNRGRRKLYEKQFCAGALFRYWVIGMTIEFCAEFKARLTPRLIAWIDNRAAKK